MCEASKSTFLLDREQTIKIAGHTLKVFRTELVKSDLVSFELIAEVSRDVVLINQLFENPAIIRGVKLQCTYEAELATAELSMLTKEVGVLASDKHVLHIDCAKVENDHVAGEIFRFLLPHVNFGSADHFTEVEHPTGGRTSSRDHIKFSLDGRDWTLRHLIDFEGTLYTVADAIVAQKSAGVKSLNLRPSGHAALEVSADGLDRAQAMDIANNFCWLLNLPLAQRVAWSELHVVFGATTRFACKRAAPFPTKASGANPIHNRCDGALKRFIEDGWLVYKNNVSWWKVTLNWFSIASENATLESSSMIYCMLFDRLSSHLLNGYEFSKQISDELSENLGDETKRNDLARRLGELLVEYAGKDKWTSDRSVSLVQQIEHWNNAPSYPNKVAKAAEMVRLKAPLRKLLSRRHSLMHDGGLKLEPKDALEFIFDLHQSIVALMLSMLGYSGKFFSLGRGECQMSDFMLRESEQQSPDPDSSSGSKQTSGYLGLFLLL